MTSLLALAIVASTTLFAPALLPTAEPQAVGMNAKKLAEMEVGIQSGIEQGQMSGCVVLIAKDGKVVWHKAYGQRQMQPTELEMTTDTLFDLASLTKPIATATSVMLLVEDGKVALEDPVAKHLPEFAQNGKEKVTVLQLLTHTGGLIPDNHMRDYADGRATAIEKVMALKLSYEPGERFVYSDVGFIVLGCLVEKLSGKREDVFVRDRVFQPLQLDNTSYVPGKELAATAETTERRGETWIQGEVHDPRAYAMDGVAGHAGLFSTAAELAVYAEMLHGQGTHQDVQIMKPETVALFTQRREVPGGHRTAGWDSLSGYSSNRGSEMSDTAFGHGGFTGTSLWIDPKNHLTVIFLGNRLHPDGKGSVNRLAGYIGNLAMSAIESN